MSSIPSATGTIAQIIKGVFEPLCPETKKILRPLALWPEDRLTIHGLNKHGTHFVCEVWRASRYSATDKLMASPGARELRVRLLEVNKLDPSGARFEAAATDITAIVINALWPETQMAWESGARVVYESLLLRWLHQTTAAKDRAEYKINKKVPAMPETFVSCEEYPLTEYQQVGVATTTYHDAAALFMEQGTGKTPTAIAKIMAEAAKLRRDEGEGSCYKVIVVVPKNIRMNWQREVHKFATLPGRVTVLRGGGVERIKLLCRAMADDPEHDAMFTIVIASYDTVKNSWDAVAMVPWNLAIADESHFIKNASSKRFRVMKALREVTQRRAILTGTPITNSILDVYAQLEFLGEGFSGFQSHKRFKSFYGKYEHNDYTKRDKLVGYQNMPFLQERLSRLAFMITKKEALPFLPEKSWDVKEISMTKEQAEIYAALQSDLAVQIGDKLSSGESDSMTINNVLTMLLRLAQITCGFMSFDEKLDPRNGEVLSAKHIKHFVPNPKLEQLVSDLKSEPETTKTIVWTVFVPTIKAISARLTAEGIKHVTFFGGTSDEDREIAERMFNTDDSVRVFIGNPAAGGVGLNLWGYDPARNPNSEMNCDHVIRYSSNWSMVQRVQSEDRCHRIGTRKAVRYTDYIVPGSIDEEILNRVTRHVEVARTIQDVREILRVVLESMPQVEAGYNDDSLELEVEVTDGN